MGYFFGVLMKAICYKCGDYKPSAWKRCTGCDYRPVGDDEKAKSLFCSSHFKSDKELELYSKHLKAGKSLEFKPKDLEVVTVVLNSKQNHKRQEKIYFLKLIGAFLLTIAFMVIFYFIQSSK
ncbi:MAG: hypothetical protein MK132_04235 [Lentisphaerales bacterium]|nr:hypothetical protein [Lentisphaerales bacterium]